MTGSAETQGEFDFDAFIEDLTRAHDDQGRLSDESGFLTVVRETLRRQSVESLAALKENLANFEGANEADGRLSQILHSAEILRGRAITAKAREVVDAKLSSSKINLGSIGHTIDASYVDDSCAVFRLTCGESADNVIELFGGGTEDGISAEKDPSGSYYAIKVPLAYLLEGGDSYSQEVEAVVDGLTAGSATEIEDAFGKGAER